MSLIDLGFLAGSIIEVPDGNQFTSLCTIGQQLERFLYLAIPVCEANEGVDKRTEVGGQTAEGNGIIERYEERCAGWGSDGNESAKGMIKIEEGGISVR